MTTVRFQSAERDAREQIRQKIFGKQFVEATPPCGNVWWIIGANDPSRV
jgi:uncharacterized linocin/CFP29 family protein